MKIIWQCNNCGACFPLEPIGGNKEPVMHQCKPGDAYSFCKRVGLQLDAAEIIQTDVENVVLLKNPR
jgi:hypothetical protein